ncbi:polysaccharide deacetylase family protein [Romboutsia lituseburensis]|uniref:polysaccharide deacetylase family protein n=1 Tax=Romboutsia lituseburensis TaxID=1537 RepID=UPI00215AE27E|nr:polysaccharide deacetylase family protein [Romboutsia lituseburensis]MCR8745427.1 polysaccharide deacetylase family protein [Romboutsia lituseburensis]
MKSKKIKITFIFLCVFTLVFSIGFNKKISHASKLQTIPVLMYHHFADESEGNATVTKSEFKKQVKYLRDNNYTTITVKDLIAFKEGKKTLPKKSVLITADDGYLSNYEFMYHILKQNNMKATISVIGKEIDNAERNIKLGIGFSKYFDWKQAKEMYNSGVIDIQSHTYDSHYKADTTNGVRGVFSKPLKYESREAYIKRIDQDIKKSIQSIQKNLGYKPEAFVYPYGEFCQTSEQVLKQNGIKATFVINNRVVSNKNKNTYLLDRITVGGKDDLNTFIKKLNSQK